MFSIALRELGIALVTMGRSKARPTNHKEPAEQLPASMLQTAEPHSGFDSVINSEKLRKHSPRTPICDAA